MRRPNVAPAVIALAVVFAAALLLFGGYIGAYYAMLMPTQIWLDDSGNPWPSYRTDSEIVRSALRPAHELDLRCRPGYWGVSPPRPISPPLPDKVIKLIDCDPPLPPTPPTNPSRSSTL